MTYNDEFLASLHLALGQKLHEWAISPGAKLSLLNISENATYLAEDGARRLILRVHRPGYHDQHEIAGELAWIAALREQGIVDTPAPVPGANGALLHRLMHDGTERSVTAFAFVPGRSPEPHEDLVAWFGELGEVTARLHAHARGWTRPPGFARKSWTVETILGRQGYWGDWRAGLGLDASGLALLERAQSAIAAQLDVYGMGEDRFGLIHGDLRLANLLVEGERLRVIDFDDCGFSWFMYDFASAVSFFEHEPVVPSLAASWVAGYRRIAPLSAEDEAILPALVLMRRMLLVAWVASHAETPTAQEMGAGYTAGALVLADRFLSAG
ncbi:phosphotransferase [Acidisoma cellulosilytica]|uniref:Phosphotransferase n=1 Tax=Acidisoma cellulosilyticum TaxID=2802395 RepID=A0A964E5T4_9PROT|nr:phosphotransferase [Acidisoma cellulosilyticum]MCB8882856.1 phosphotransferase [Acidisoma cellulosilyticum]